MPRFQRLFAHRPTLGGLRHRIVVEAPADTPDGAGGATRVWQVVAAVWAAIEPFGAEARIEAARPEQAVTHRITIRWRADIDAGKRLRHGTRVFAILAVADADAARRRLVCLVEEVKP